MHIHLVKRVPFRSDVLSLHSGKLLSHSKCFPKGSLLLLSPGRFLLCHKGSRRLKLQFDVLFSMKAFIASLICLQLERLGVFKKQIILVSHSSHTRYQSVKIKATSLSQLCDDLHRLSLRQSMCVSVSKSALPLDFQVKSKYSRCTTSSTDLTCRTTNVRQ